MTALEFALVSPLVFLVLFFSIEMGIAMMADATLARTAAVISRQGQLGGFSDDDCNTAVRQALQQGMSRWVYDPGNLLVDVSVYSPGNYTPAPPDDENYIPACNTGERGDLVVYRLGFSRTGFSGVLHWLGIDVLRFERTIIIQNEP